MLRINNINPKFQRFITWYHIISCSFFSRGKPWWPTHMSPAALPLPSPQIFGRGIFSHPGVGSGSAPASHRCRSWLCKRSRSPTTCCDRLKCFQWHTWQLFFKTKGGTKLCVKTEGMLLEGSLSWKLEFMLSGATIPGGLVIAQNQSVWAFDKSDKDPKSSKSNVWS
jgi:hypothetical protein